jgi:hypothetical protein
MINKETIRNYFNYTWDAEKMAQRLILKNGAEIFIKFSTCISDGKRKAHFSSPDENVGKVTKNYGDSILYIDDLLCELWNNGFPIIEDDKDNLRVFLEMDCKRREHDEYYHTQKGIVNIRGNDYILGERIYTATSAKFKNSIYKHMGIMPELVVKGDKAMLLDGLQKYVKGRKPVLELSIINGTYGIFNQILQEKEIPNSVTAFIGEAHRGKTVTATLAPFVWTKISNLIKEAATEAAIQKSIMHNGILPLVANDPTVKNKKYDETVVGFANGKGVERYYSNDLRHFHPLLITSNTSIVNIGKYGGFNSRIFEFAYDNFTDSAQHARDIKNWVAQCHGVAGEELLKYLASEPNLKSAVEKTYERWLKMVEDKHGNVNGRQAEIIALTLTAGEFFGKALGYEFDLDAIREELARVSGTSRDGNEKALEVQKEIMLSYKESPDKWFSYKGTFDGYDPKIHIGFADKGILYIRGKNIKTCSFEKNDNKEIKKYLYTMGILVTDSTGKWKIRGNGYTYRITKIKSNNTFYAFKIAA